MKTVSIVVPVYNAQRYLEECVGSLLAQTYENVEILLVENNSSDNSFELCKKFAESYSNVKAFTLPHAKGPSSARNFGISKASGEYIGFCDSDDYVKSEMVTDLVTYLEKSESDYVISDMYAERISSDLGLPWEDGAVFDAAQIKDTMIPLYIGNESDNDTAIPVWGSVVKCLFKKETIQKGNIRFPEELSFAEDLIFTLRYLSCCRRAVVRDKSYYFYRYNGASLMNSYNNYKPEMTAAYFELMREMSAILKDNAIYEACQNRFFTTARAYIKECVGNACKKSAQRKFFDCAEEVRQIVNDELTRQAFCRFDASEKKKKLIYTLIQKKKVLLLTLYYSFRARM